MTQTYYKTGEQKSVTDWRGYRSDYTIDALGRTTIVDEAVGQTEARTMTTVYNKVSETTSTVDYNGVTGSTVYDALGRAITSTDAVGETEQRSTATHYDAVGNVIRQIDAEGNATRFGHDGLNRQVVTIDANGAEARTFYDAVGNVLKSLDENGNATEHLYDVHNRLIQETDAEGGIITRTYDTLGNLKTLKDPVNNVTTFVYDNLNRVTDEEDPHGNSATFAYDDAGRMTSTTDRLGRRRDFAYDELGRVKTEKWYDDTPTLVNTLTFTYDDAGNQLTAADQNGTYTMSYDALNRTEVVEGVWDTTLTFSYDDNGNRTLVVDSEGGTETSTYDPLNRLETRSFGGISTTYLRFDFTYTDRDQVSNVRRYDDLTATNKIGETDYTYDSLGRVENIHHKDGGGSNVSNYTYAYDAGSRVTSETRNGTVTNYQYDDTNQLTDDDVTSYSYDANGNRTMSGYSTGTGNQLTNDGTYTYTYDNAGNLIKKSKGAALETWDYGWDNNNQLIWVEKRATDGGTLQMRAEYKYDVFGNRIQSDVDADGAGGGGTVTTRFAVDGWKTGGGGFKGNENFDVWADLDSGNNLTMRRLFTNGIDGVFARIDSDGNEAWYLADRLGSVREMVDDSGTLQNVIAYDGVGAITSESNSSFGDRLKFAGREWAVDLSLYYYRGRWYDPATSRWISEDPDGFDGGDANLYRYVFNGSTLWTDPSGMQVPAPLPVRPAPRPQLRLYVPPPERNINMGPRLPAARYPGHIFSKEKYAPPYRETSLERNRAEWAWSQLWYALQIAEQEGVPQSEIEKIQNTPVLSRDRASFYRARKDMVWEAIRKNRKNNPALRFPTEAETLGQLNQIALGMGATEAQIGAATTIGRKIELVRHLEVLNAKKREQANRERGQNDEENNEDAQRRPRNPNRIGKRNRYRTRKEAYEAAKRAGNGAEPVNHANDPRGPHFHPGDGKGRTLNHDHYYYPKHAR